MPIEIVITLLLIMFAGFLSHRLKLLPEQTSAVLDKFLIKISFPLVIFLGIASADLDKISEFLPFILINLILVSAAFVGVFLLTRILRLDYAKSGTLLLGSVTGNVAFMGFPVIQGFFGEVHLEFAYMYIIVFSFTLAFVGLGLVELSQNDQKIAFGKLIKRGILSPLTMAAILGTVALVLQIEFPRVVLQPATLLAQVTIPLALFSIGCFISANFRIHNPGLAIFAVSLKLFLLPLFVLAAYSLINGGSEIALQVSVMQAAMPAAMTNLAIASEYKLDQKLMSTIILLGTVSSALTLVLWAAVL